MARKRKQQMSADSLPGVGPESPVFASHPSRVPVAEPAKPVEVERKTLRVDVPFVAGLQGYTRRRIDVVLSGSQAETLKGVQHGLESVEAKLRNGRYVSAPLHALLWLIENATPESGNPGIPENGNPGNA